MAAKKKPTTSGLSETDMDHIRGQLGIMLKLHIESQHAKLLAGELTKEEQRLLFDMIKHFDVAMRTPESISQQVLDDFDLSGIVLSGDDYRD